MVNFYIYGMLFVSLWKSAASSKSCVKIEVVEDFAKDGIVVVEQNDSVSLTFDVNTDACQSNTQKLTLLSHERELIVDVCTIVFTNGTCQQQLVEQPCSCVNSTKHRVHFHQSITGVDYKIYYWTAASNTSILENLMELIFVIRTPAMLTNCTQILNKTEEEFQSRPVCSSSFDGLILIIVLCACVVVGAIISVICIVKLRRKTRGHLALPFDAEMCYKSHRNHPMACRKQD